MRAQMTAAMQINHEDTKARRTSCCAPKAREFSLRVFVSSWFH